MNDAILTSRDKLARDFRVVLADAEELFKATANETGERVKAARARLESNFEPLRARMAEMERSAAERARAAAEETDRFAHENPWKTAGIAAGVGLLVGLLIGRSL